jgi:hypothetical protein
MARLYPCHSNAALIRGMGTCGSIPSVERIDLGGWNGKFSRFQAHIPCSTLILTFSGRAKNCTRKPKSLYHCARRSRRERTNQHICHYTPQQTTNRLHEQTKGVSNSHCSYHCFCQSLQLTLPTDLQQVGTIKIDLDDIDFKSFKKKKNGHLWWGKTFYDIEYSVEVAMGDESGLLRFTVMCKGQRCGSASIDFSKD